VHLVTVYFDKWSRSDTATLDPDGYRGVVIRNIRHTLAAGRVAVIRGASSEQVLGGVSNMDTVAPLTMFERAEDGASVSLPDLSTSQVERYIAGLFAKAKIGVISSPTKCLQVSWVGSALAELGSLLADASGISYEHTALGLYALRLLRIKALEDGAEVDTVCE